ncbi:MAG: hypothetical protein CVU63_17855, partial [Deltaproteobacteria bacterium HGW-Deltaproteobacteria-20]
LGEGGMGAVYRATNIATGRWVALKAMHPEYALKKEIVRRFMREAKAATAIRHPNVIEILDVVEAEGGEPVMVMELLEGEPLDDLLTRMGPLPLGEVARIMTPVISAVGAAHGLGIIHRDLKPENIFLARGPDGGRLTKVLDFGIAKVLDPNQINELATKSGATRTGSMLGTPHYMSIEQACGEKDIDHRTDVWSLGIILYNMLSGHRPYDGDNYGQILRALMTTTPPPIEKLVPSLPADIVDIVNRCTARTRDERPKDLREVYEVLSRYTHDTTTQAPPSIAGPLMSREEMMSGVTLQAASVYVSKPSGGSVQQPGSKRLSLIVGVGLAFLVLGGGRGCRSVLRTRRPQRRRRARGFVRGTRRGGATRDHDQPCGCRGRLDERTATERLDGAHASAVAHREDRRAQARADSDSDSDSDSEALVHGWRNHRSCSVLSDRERPARHRGLWLVNATVTGHSSNDALSGPPRRSGCSRCGRRRPVRGSASEEADGGRGSGDGRSAGGIPR